MKMLQVRLGPQIEPLITVDHTHLIHYPGFMYVMNVKM
jgi:hypothetical protein